MISNTGRGFTADEIDLVCHTAFHHGPWLDREACVGLATILNRIFTPGGASNEEETSPFALSIRPSSRTEMKVRRAAYKVLLEACTPPTEEHFYADSNDKRAAQEIAEVLTRNRRLIVGSDWKKIRPWASVTLALAFIVSDFMRDAGHVTIAVSRNARLPHFLELILPKFINEDEEPPQREAIAAFLNEKGNEGRSPAEMLKLDE